MISKAKMIIFLKEQLKEKDEEISRLKELVGLKSQNVPCKSSFCIACKHFLGYIGSEPMCDKLDDSPCKDFEFNGKPLPSTAYEFVPMQSTDEYLLSIAKQGNY